MKTKANRQWLNPVLVGRAARRPASEVICEVINIEPPPHWRKKRDGQLKPWTPTLKDYLVPLSGPEVFGIRQWNRDGMTIGIVWSQDRG